MTKETHREAILRCYLNIMRYSRSKSNKAFSKKYPDTIAGRKKAMKDAKRAAFPIE